jgi:hypothetical protein
LEPTEVPKAAGSEGKRQHTETQIQQPYQLISCKYKLCNQLCV